MGANRPEDQVLFSAHPRTAGFTFAMRHAQMYCLDAATGKQLWRHKYGRNAKGSPVWGDGKIYIAEVNAKFHILKPGPKSCEELSVQYFPSPDGTSERRDQRQCRRSPTVAFIS